MKKTLLGLIAALLIAAGGFFGFRAYVKHQVVAEVDAAFEQIRHNGGKASYGQASYDIWNRTLTIDDITAESSSQPPITAKIANLTASGVNSTGDRFSVDLAEITGLEIDIGSMAPTVGRIIYTAPRIVASHLSGPSRMELSTSTTAEPVETYRSLIAQFVAMSASSIAAPTLSAKVGASSATPGGAETVYSKFVLEGISDGRIATAHFDEASVIMTSLQTGKPVKITSRMVGFSAVNFDAKAVAALLDPQNARDDRVVRIYRQISMGAYEISPAQDIRMRMDGLTVDDVSVRPSLVQLPKFLSLIPNAGAVSAPAQVREMLDRAASLYEGISIGACQLRGLSMETPQGPLMISSIRFNLDKGKSDFVFEGFEGHPPTGPFKIGRFALKSFDAPKLLRMSPDMTPGPSSPGKAFALFRVMDGVEINDVTTPFKDGRRQVRIDTINLSWDRLIGSIPTRAHLVARMNLPLDPANPALLPLVKAGVDSAAIDADIGATWSEDSSTFALDFPRLEIGELLNTSARLSLANVPRGVFSNDSELATKLAPQFEAGTLELSLRDLGAIDIFVAQYARGQGIGREAARSAIIDSIKAFGEKASANPDAAAAVSALTSFMTTPRQTLTLKLTPLGKVPAMQLLDLLKTDPAIALAQFRIEASTGL